MKKENLHSGELAKLAGVNKETIRYYEKKGMLNKPKRSLSGYRTFTEDDLNRLVFIKNAQQLGFTLKEIKELLQIADGKFTGCEEVRKIAQNRLDFINTQIESLSKLKTVLKKLIQQCNKTTEINNCPIIESLSDKERRN
ncbi:MAG: MerR family transcriptional regulator [Candidatus Zixiibacteriota bacterium]